MRWRHVPLAVLRCLPLESDSLGDRNGISIHVELVFF